MLADRGLRFSPVVFVVIACTSHNVEGTVFDAQFEQKLDSFVEATIGCWLVPGLTLSVFKENQTWSKGYGYSDLDSATAVTSDTLFNIGSVSKSFTMALLANLLMEKNMTWTTKLRDILGTEYNFTDEYRSKEMTLKDLLSHRTGLARLDEGLVAGFPDNLTREQLAKQFRFLPEVRPFRDSFLYNNYMYTYLGHICEVLGGDTWENLLQDRILTPLGMTSTKIMKTPDDVQTGNVAKPYININGSFQNGTLKLYSIHPQEPAGAILSTGNDMIKWMEFLLNEGKKSDGTVLVDEKLMKSAMKDSSANTRIEMLADRGLRVLPVVFVVIACTSHNVEGTVFDAQFEQKLDSFVEATIGCWLVPGLTQSVFKENQTWSKGYGYSDLDSATAVTSDTLFNIGSVSKSFTMALLANLLMEKNMTWTTKLRDILGTEYNFTDEYRSNEMTLKDLLSHRTGLARLDEGLVAGFPDNLTREQLAKQFRFLPEVRPFRDSFLYNNYMYTYLGHICEVLGGDTWENLLQDRILTPLGMTSTKIMKTPDDVQTGNVAKPYININGSFQNGTLKLYSIHPQEPAGAILSTGNDMMKWMEFLLNKGKKSDGTVLVDEKLMKSAMKAAVAISSDGYLRLNDFTMPTWPVGMTSVGYGHALFVSSYRGYELIWHSGGWFSYITRMFLYPDKKTGVFVSTNGPAFQGYASMATRVVEFFTSDGALGLEPWLNETTACTFPKPWVPDDDEAQSSNATIRSLSNIDAYTGYYNHSWLPGIQVSRVENDSTKLRFEMNRMAGDLHSTDEDDKFKMEVLHPWELMIEYLDKHNITKKMNVTFEREDGHVTTLVATFEVNVTYKKVIPKYTSGSSMNRSTMCVPVLMFVVMILTRF